MFTCLNHSPNNVVSFVENSLLTTQIWGVRKTLAPPLIFEVPGTSIKAIRKVFRLAEPARTVSTLNTNFVLEWHQLLFGDVYCCLIHVAIFRHINGGAVFLLSLLLLI